MIHQTTPPELKEYFEYLDDLRRSGDTNMMGATPYLVDFFGISKQYAKTILLEWMKTFEARLRAGEVAGETLK